jgi:putative transposase
MPEMLVVDNGKEFHSRAMQRACQLYGCNLRYRPAAKARFGSVLERLFGTVNSQFIHLLEGNTQIMKQARMVSKSVRPENFVTWSLPALHLAMEEYFTKIYGTENHPAHGEEPIQYLQHRMVETGERRRRLVRFDDAFRIETCPSPRDGDTRKVDPSRGVKVTNFWYWNDVFRKPGMGKKTVEVRIDPGEAWIVYVLIENRWFRCISKLAGKVRNLTEVELRYAYEEIQKRFGTPKKSLSPERVAEHLRILDAKAIDAKLSAQQAEAKAIYEPLGMATATQGKTSKAPSGALGQEDGAVVPPSAFKQVAQHPSPTTSKPAPGPRPKVARTAKPAPREQPKSTFSTGPTLVRDPLSSNNDSEPSKEMPYELELF